MKIRKAELKKGAANERGWCRVRTTVPTFIVMPFPPFV
jgi:hypothetical protein